MVQLNLSRTPDSPRLQIERTVEPWVKPAPTLPTPGDAGHPDHAAF
ncbi:hypothetical protein ACFQGW_08960 [Xanthomonas theicola]